MKITEEIRNAADKFFAALAMAKTADSAVETEVKEEVAEVKDEATAEVEVEVETPEAVAETKDETTAEVEAKEEVEVEATNETDELRKRIETLEASLNSSVEMNKQLVDKLTVILANDTVEVAETKDSNIDIKKSFNDEARQAMDNYLNKK